MRSKRACEHLHAKRRAFERYGFEFTRKEHDEIIHIIHTGKFLYHERRSGRVHLYDIDYKESIMRILFDRNRQQIITFLPLVD